MHEIHRIVNQCHEWRKMNTFIDREQLRPTRNCTDQNVLACYCMLNIQPGCKNLNLEKSVHFTSCSAPSTRKNAGLSQRTWRIICFDQKQEDQRPIQRLILQVASQCWSKEKNTLVCSLTSKQRRYESPDFTLWVGAWHRGSYQLFVSFHQSKRSVETFRALLGAFIGVNHQRFGVTIKFFKF